jgi:peptidoglycan/xylan/chitin deacetylase (PgdA/CDA1 family)
VTEPCKHVVTLSFDDGFDCSSRKTAEIFERFGLSAAINVVARGHLGEPDEPWHTRWPKGDFGLWNELQARGHEIMPHGLAHVNKANVPLEAGRQLIEACLELFARDLDGFDASRAVFAFPYNASTPELEEWLAGVVRGFRTGGNPIMPLPQPVQSRIACTSFGPGPCDEHLEHAVDELLARPSGWLCYNVHGLDGEGWGPLSTATLERLLDRLVARDHVRVLPALAALDLGGA